MKRRHFNTREEWADYAVRVLRGSGGSTQVNLYSWRPGTVQLLRALDHAKRLGLVREHRNTKPARREFSLIEPSKGAT